jgi:hypothetical protein
MRKVLLFLLTLLTLGFAAQTVSAQTVWDGTADISWYDADQTSFDISTPEQLAGVAQLVNGGTSFNGKTLNLTADLWLNSTGDSTNNWVPIGGYATATGEDQSSGNSFRGVFNGHGHAIYNLYCEKQNYFHAGLFGCIQNPCTIDSLVMINPVLKSKGMMGAITGMTRSGGQIYIRYCLVINGRLQGTGGNNIGFMVGANYPNSSGTYIENCGATGTITGNYPGGLGGNSQSETFTNCYFAGAISGSPAGGIAAYSGTINNCYSYVSTSISGGNDGTVSTQAEMQSATMITNLGDAFKLDNGVNDGYPVMSYMAGVSPVTAEICQGESVTITAFGYDSYAWSNGATTESITVTPTTTTTYSVTCTSNGVATVNTSTITVYPQAVITAEVAASADGQVHATLNNSSFTVGCGSSDNISLVVTPETNYRVSRVTLNGTQLYGDEFGEGTQTITINPGGTLGAVKVFLSNEYTISITELQDTGDTLHVSSLVQPYGSNGKVTVNAGSDQTFAFNNTARYVLQDAEIDGTSQGAITTYAFTNIHENHSIVVTYVDSCGIFAIPFFDDFESVSSGIPECYAKNTGNSSYPTINSYYPYQGKSIYVYNYSYGESSSQVPCLILPRVDEQINLNELMLQFYGRANSDAGVFLVGVMTDPDDMSTFTTVEAITPTNTNGEYQLYTTYLGGYQGTGRYIAIKFPVTAYCLLCIDNMTVDYAPSCSPVTSLEVTNVFGSNATLTWNPTTVGEVSEYNILLTDNVTGSEDVLTTTETTYLLTGLNELTSYSVAVYTSCTNGQTSDTAYASFMTPCNNPVNYSVGTATGTNSYLPTYIFYGNTYSQQIITANVFEGEASDFASLSVKDNSTSSAIRACDIYLAHVPASMTLADGWILPSATNDITFSQVFSGDVHFGTGDWVKIDFDTVFPYNGTDNLLVVFNDHTNSYINSHSYDVVENSNTASMARYAYRDSNPYDAFNPGVSGYVLSVVNALRLGYCDEGNCISPNTLTASGVTSTSVDLEWVSVGSESSWEVEYRADADTEWTSAGNVSATMTSLYSLEPNTVYTVRVRALCSSTEVSPWSESVSFRTQCDAISNLPYSTSFEDASGDYVFCWSRLASDASHMVYRMGESAYSHSGSNCLDFAYTPSCWTMAIMPAFDASIPVSNLMLDFWLDKTGNSGYFEVGVMTDPEDATTFEVVDTIESTLIGNAASYYEHIIVSLDSYTGSGQYVAFRVSNGVSCGYRMDDLLVSEIPNCMYPTNLQALGSTNTSATLTWTEMGEATGWNILYGATGFDPETEGTTVYADADTFEVTGLDNITTYDFYVQADCGSIQSQWVGPVTITTGTYTFGVTGSDTLNTCSVVLYDDGGANGNYSNSCNYTVVIYPETDGSGISITGTVHTYSGYESYQGVLTIYEGVGTTGNVLGTYAGTHTVNIAYGGPVTINFTSGSYSQSYYPNPGFALTVQCTECFPPSNLAVSNQTLDGATVTWSGNADSYAVYLGGAMTGYYTTNDTTYTFTGLNGSSTYSVQVRALCGTDSSLLSQTAHFNTACAPITVTADNPWFEDFEGYAGGGAQSFVCWETPVTEVVDNGTSPFVYCGHSPSCHSGANSAEMKGSNNMLVLPEFSNDIQDLRLSFWATTTSTSNYGTVEIGYITDINDPTTFVVLGPAGTPGPRGGSGSTGNGNLMGPFDFNGVTATTARMAIKFTGYSGLSWNLDDFTVSLAPNCPSPVKTSVQASNIGGHVATISFVDNDANHNSWTVYYKMHSDSVWSNVVTSTTTVDLTGLDPETQYDVYVVTNCATPDTEEDATNTIQFTTTVACPAPTGITATNVGMTTATLSWQGTADSYNITCGTDNLTSTTNSIDLTGLTAGTTYMVTVVSDCGVEGTSSAATFSFSTALCDVVDQCVYTFNLTDSYGDGWNGASITVQQNNVTVATVGMTSGASSTVSVTLCDNQSTALLWNSGNYDSEVGFEVVDPSGAIIFTQGSSPSGTLTTFTTNCSGSGPATCQAPTNLTVNTITENSAVAIWTPGGSETSWNLQYKAATSSDWGTTIPCTQPSYSFSSLAANTQYVFRVQADCGDGNVSAWSSEQTFTTAGGSGPVVTDPTVATNAAENIEQTTATLKATITNPDEVTITAKGFQWKATNGGTYTQIAGTGTGNTFTANLTNLTPNTSYTYKAFITFNGTTVEGSEMTFTTQPEDVEPCETPTNLHASTCDAHSITIGWNANGNATSWNIRYRVENGSWSSATSTTNSYVISGLVAETVYEIQVQANCGDGNLSEWCEPIHISTTIDGIANWLESSVSLYPNPAREYIDIRVDGDLNVTMMEVYDVYGKLINTVNVIDNPTRINVSSLANGMYFVRVTTEAGSVTKTFVKR